jgi:transposase-like protein
MSEPRLDRVVRHRLAVLRHAEEVTGNVAMTCRYYGITRQSFYTWKRRDEADGPEGLRPRSTRPKSCPHAVGRCRATYRSRPPGRSAPRS